MCSHIAAFHVQAQMRTAMMNHIMTLPLGYIESEGTGKIRKIVTDSSAATETYLAHTLPDKAVSKATPIGQTVFSFKRFKEAINEYEKWTLGFTKKMRKPMVGFTTAVNSIFVFIIIAAYVFGGHEITAAFGLNLLFYIIITPILTTTLMKLAYAGEAQMQVVDGLKRMGDVMNREPLKETANGQIPKDSSVSLQDVTFAYENAKKNAVDHISIEIKAVIIVTIANLAFMIPVGLLYLLASDILNGGIPGSKLPMYIGGILSAKGEIDALTFFMYLLVVSRMYDPFQVALENLSAIISTDTQCKRMDEILSHEEQDGSKTLSNQGYDINFDHVGFSYDGNEQILKDVSFTAKQGEVTALIGPSGSGKTTVSRLAARFWDINKGTITVGGMDISKIDPETLLSLYSIVFQDVTLFNNTIMENIRIGRKDATDEEVMAAAKLANCEDFIEKMPQKWDTMIGENGSELSGGERQRISIARAFLKDGVVAENGAPEELKACDGIYRHMVELQIQAANWKM